MFKSFLITGFMAVVLCSFMTANSLAYDDEEESASRNYPNSLGPYVMFKAGINAGQVQNGYVNVLNINGIPDFGITGYMPFDKDTKIGLTADLGYNTYSFDMKQYGCESNHWTEKYGYIVLSPNINYYGFLLGFTFGLPVSATKFFPNSEFEINTELLSTMVDIHVGGMLPLFASETGRFNMVIQGGYFITGLNDETNMDQSLKAINPHPAHIELGLNYLFNVNLR